MTYKRFEDLPVWNDAIALAHAVYGLVDDRRFRDQGDLRSQLQRASLSISNNIAEGFERGTNGELLTFLYIAKGSAGETRSALRFACGLPGLLPVRPCIEPLIGKAELVGKQIGAWAQKLCNSELRGQRYATDADKSDLAQRQRAQAFLERLDRIKRGEARPDDLPQSAAERG